MSRYLFIAPLVLLSCVTYAQADSLPYADIGAYPASYTPGSVVSRMIDALGFRYYWATEGLREEDLAHRPTPDARSAYETVEHIYGLSEMIVNAPRGDTMVRPEDWSALTFPELRARTLQRLRAASQLFAGLNEADLQGLKVMFSYGGNYSEFPLWNLVNGPVADAIYHTGQLITLRRETGNPSDPRVNVFTGKLRE